MTDPLGTDAGNSCHAMGTCKTIIRIKSIKFVNPFSSDSSAGTIAAGVTETKMQTAIVAAEGKESLIPKMIARPIAVGLEGYEAYSDHVGGKDGKLTAMEFGAEVSISGASGVGAGLLMSGACGLATGGTCNVAQVLAAGLGALIGSFVEVEFEEVENPLYSQAENDENDTENTTDSTGTGTDNKDEQQEGGSSDVSTEIKLKSCRGSREGNVGSGSIC